MRGSTEVTLDRPKANAIDGPLSRVMSDLFAGFRDDPDLRVAILTGAGQRFFSAGAKILYIPHPLSYLGAHRTMPNYNVMGVAKASLEANVRYMAVSLGADGHRVNAISAGPIKTLAAAGISDFRKMLDHVERTAPMRRTISAEEYPAFARFCQAADELASRPPTLVRQ